MAWDHPYREMYQKAYPDALLDQWPRSPCSLYTDSPHLWHERIFHSHSETPQTPESKPHSKGELPECAQYQPPHIYIANSHCQPPIAAITNIARILHLTGKPLVNITTIHGNHRLVNHLRSNQMTDLVVNTIGKISIIQVPRKPIFSADQPLLIQGSPESFTTVEERSFHF